MVKPPPRNLPTKVERQNQTPQPAASEQKLPSFSRNHLNTSVGALRGTRIDRSEGAKALMAKSVGLPSPPSSWEDDAYYRVQLKRTVFHGSHPLRPRDDVVVLGSFAKTIVDDISGAAKI